MSPTHALPGALVLLVRIVIGRDDGEADDDAEMQGTSDSLEDAVCDVADIETANEKPVEPDETAALYQRCRLL